VPTKQRGKAKKANQVPKGKGAAKKKAASAQPADVLTERQKLDAQLSRRAQRRIISNPFVSGHCFFEALSLSNSFTTGMGDKAGAKLIRAVRGRAYLDPCHPREFEEVGKAKGARPCTVVLITCCRSCGCGCSLGWSGRGFSMATHVLS